MRIILILFPFSSLHLQATEHEKLYRSRKEKFKEEQQSNHRKSELQKRLGVIRDEIADVGRVSKNVACVTL